MESVESVSLLMEELSMDYFPEDIVFKEILTKLPVKSLMRFKCVSKPWLARISSMSFFADKPCDLIHARHDGVLRLFLIRDGQSDLAEIDTSYLAIPEETDTTWHLIGSSNGLVLIRRESDRLVLWNPATREFRNIPEPTVAPASAPGMPSDPNAVHHSFGFGEDVDDYKIVRIGEYTADRVLKEGTNLLDVQIYTKRSGCWRTAGAKRGDLQLRFGSEHGVEINGVIHWTLVVLRYYRNDRNDDNDGDYATSSPEGRDFRVAAFDLRTEELKELDGPVSKSKTYWRGLELFDWKGCLGGLMSAAERDVEVWVKTSDRNRQGSCWTNVMHIRPYLSRWPFSGVLRGEFVFEILDKAILFNPISKRATRFDKAYGSSNNIIPRAFRRYVPSLVSPN